ncbi:MULTISPECIES: long-chain fatty acid--CoA ligase [unclassified Paenibacillus]|uniref:long-chain-fatty-acid--CoA ligase n=1 Tax=unclassified Paenibacillus TaxID=185978 RepID=UPI001C12713C|nr:MULTISPECIES: long-chain fatty acid--CoA ligase [unclassified Paenibacillus]MBU5440710.1 long-chain fatty acid--CoA ligase [Paenibacillus sp. MSJ-34]CAH0120436.1 Long-chain-fatty-acid--CoA ligase [Paenibacillus sp. CECT 9249]
MSSSMIWLRHYPQEVAETYDYPEHNIAEFLIESARRFPDNTALYFMGKRMTYRELLHASYQFANALRSLGVEAGERVAIMLPNCPQTVIAYFGALMNGSIVVQTNPLYMESELRQQMADSGAIAIVTLDFMHKRVLNIQSKTDLRHVIVTSMKDYLPFPKNVLYPIKAKKDGLDLSVQYVDGVRSFTKLLSAAPATPVCAEVNAREDTAVLQYTGGTTGVPKGAMLTHYNLIVNTLQVNHWFYRSDAGKERYLAALPCFHVFGLTVLLNQCMYAAGMLILLPRFEVAQVLETIDKMRPTIFPGAPTMYIALIHHPDIRKYDLSSIKACVSGSAPLPVEVQDRFEALSGGRLIEGYGLTEASPVTHANTVWEKRKIGTIGIPFPDTEAMIVDPETGEELPIGEIGELAVKGPQVMKGYWNRPEETSIVLKNGWLYTGDMGTMDEDGFFAIVDRKKDVIIAGGFKIYPREVEEVLFEHPAIKEAAVAGVPDEYRGETVKAYIVLKEGAALSERELDVWCRERLAAYKVPRKVEFRESLPKTIIGKVLRRKLLEEELNGTK